ncbi:hypothetical protein D3C84_929070 [compost metagenome]
MSKLITTADILKKYLGFTKYEVTINDDFMHQLIEWKTKDTKIYKYTLLLMKDVQLHPFNGGMG